MRKFWSPKKFASETIKFKFTSQPDCLKTKRG